MKKIKCLLFANPKNHASTVREQKRVIHRQRTKTCDLSDTDTGFNLPHFSQQIRYKNTMTYHNALATKTTSRPMVIKAKPLPSIAPYGANAIEINHMSFSYDTSNPTTNNDDDNKNKQVLNNVNFILETGSRCLLIGANGSGKSTLLRILAGRHLVKPDGCVRVLGLNAFRETKLNFHRAYLDCDWGMRSVAFAGGSVPLMADIAVKNMMERLQASYPERREELVAMLGIDLNWRMHQLSDGQRRRVQILLGLIRPFKVLLLDEITTSLDVCVRQDLLRWLQRESDVRGATILYATHIFDGLDDWPTHVHYLTDEGRSGWQGRLEELDYYQELKRRNHPAKMLAVADHWLRAELERNRAKRIFEKAAGSSVHEADPTDRHGGYGSGRNIPLDVVAPNASAVTSIADVAM